MSGGVPVGPTILHSATRGWVAVAGLVAASFALRTAFYFSNFPKNPKRKKFPIGKVSESNFLPKQIHLRFQGLKQADKHPLCTPLEL